MAFDWLWAVGAGTLIMLFVILWQAWCTFFEAREKKQGLNPGK